MTSLLTTDVTDGTFCYVTISLQIPLSYLLKARITLVNARRKVPCTTYHSARFTNQNLKFKSAPQSYSSIQYLAIAIINT